MPWKIFFCEPSGRARVEASRRSNGHGCNGRDSHSATRIVFAGAAAEADSIFQAGRVAADYPEKCEGCDYRFAEDDSRSSGLRRIYVRRDTGEEVELGRAPIGACWDATWYHDWRTGPDGRSLVVRTPGGDWFIDSEASNCTKKGDETHRCWIRHGRPEDGTLHVDKNGVTCSAGAGSIQCGSYHGFLRNGVLTDHC